MERAALGDHRSIVELMLTSGATNYDEAMTAAARCGHRSIVELMLNHGATDYDGALISAARGAHRAHCKTHVRPWRY